MSANTPKIILPASNQFGFCEGVEAAHQLMTRVTDVAREYGHSTVYGYHEIVHNESVVAFHESRGVVFVDDVSAIPERSPVVGSAHGSSPEVAYELKRKDGLFIDGVCALVTHTHKAVQQARLRGEKLLYIIGDKVAHDEVVGTLGHVNYELDAVGNLVNNPVEHAVLQLPKASFGIAVREQLDRYLTPSGRYRVVGQTTLLASGVETFIAELGKAIASVQPEAKIARLDAKRQVCFAVEDRQEGVRVHIAAKPDAVVVVTSPKSKNGMQYVHLAESLADKRTEVVAVANADDEQLDHLSSGDRTIVVTGSASTPDDDMRAVVTRLGGSPELVPYERPAFKIPSTSEAELRLIFNAWHKKLTR